MYSGLWPFLAEPKWRVYSGQGVYQHCYGTRPSIWVILAFGWQKGVNVYVFLPSVDHVCSAVAQHIHLHRCRLSYLEHPPRLLQKHLHPSHSNGVPAPPRVLLPRLCGKGGRLLRGEGVFHFFVSIGGAYLLRILLVFAGIRAPGLYSGRGACCTVALLRYLSSTLPFGTPRQWPTP